MCCRRCTHVPHNNVLFLHPSHDICSYQELNITINITKRANNALVTNNGPIPHRGNGSFEYDISSSNLKREVDYFMTVTVNTGFESLTLSYPFSKHALRLYDYCVHKQINLGFCAGQKVQNATHTH